VLKLLAQRAEADVHHPVVANLGNDVHRDVKDQVVRSQRRRKVLPVAIRRTFGFSLGSAVDRLYWPALVMPE
jgi:hypothetical protein